jgi:thioredoxin 1
MIYRRLFLAAIAGAAVALSTGLLTQKARAGTPFTQQAFDAARAAGKPVLVDITASWCPTCKAQRPIIERLSADPRFADLVVLEVDFDSQKDVVRAFKARAQSTLIVFRDTAETGRSVGDTDPAAIEALLATAI